MSARLLTISNNFHGTEARVLSGQLSRATASRVRRALCGQKDCLCGGVLGQRGGQLQPDGARTAEVVAEQDRQGHPRITVLYVNRDGNR